MKKRRYLRSFRIIDPGLVKVDPEAKHSLFYPGENVSKIGYEALTIGRSEEVEDVEIKEVLRRDEPDDDKNDDLDEAVFLSFLHVKIVLQIR